MEKNILLVINPAAGRCHKAACVDKIPSFFKKAGVPFRLVVTRKDYRADAVVREEFTNDFTQLIVGGGDGTINDAINGLKDFHRPVGFIPMGSGNDFIKNLHLGNTLEDHLQTALNGTERVIDL
ncbi:MAG: acylglycerol kinase family protein, partial [Cyclobacteriaceae bacterium]|nr:acylglycerol kinase family protein [Cyclobacteriaceae bacterium]